MLSKDVDVGSELLERRMDNHLFYCDFLRSNFSELVYKRGGQFHTSLANRRMSLTISYSWPQTVEYSQFVSWFQDHKSQFPTEISLS